MNEKYAEIIGLPHHVSPTRAPMPRSDRAAQFAPYSALSGYENAVEETARLTNCKIELDESEIEKINQILIDVLTSEDNKTIKITFFRPDERKNGGKYITLRGQIGRLDEINKEIILISGHSIHIDDIVKIEIILDTPE